MWSSNILKSPCISYNLSRLVYAFHRILCPRKIKFPDFPLTLTTSKIFPDLLQNSLTFPWPWQPWRKIWKCLQQFVVFKYIEIHCTFSLQLCNGHTLACSCHRWFVSAVSQVCVRLLYKFYVFVSYLAENLRAAVVFCIYRTDSMFESVQREQ